MKIITFLKSCLVTLFILPLACLATLPATINGESSPTLAPMLQQAMPAVVNILVKGKITRNEDPFSQPPESRTDDGKKPHGQAFEAEGSGVVIETKQGYILTNAHLVSQAESITVTLNDGRRFKAKLIGKDVASDIAVLQVKAQGLKTIPVANSNQLKVGDFVVAIGNPYGLDQTVTSGIVSAVKRSDLGIEGYEDFIQTDASINPGNSGGALVDLNGRLVGINTAILAPSGGNVGIGFAIPINMAQHVAQQLVKYGHVDRGIIGVMMQTLTPELADAFHESKAKGAIITKVTPNSPAAKAKLQVGDVIQSINDNKIETSSQMRNSIGLLRAGSTFKLNILRNGKLMQVSVKSTAPSVYQSSQEKEDPFFYGVVLRNFDAQIPNAGHVQGVEISRLKESSPTWQAGLRNGDIIVKANRIDVHNLQQLAKVASIAKETLLVNVIRGNGAGYFVIR